MFTVVLEPAAQRDLKKLSKAIEERVVADLGKLEADPRRGGAKKLAGFQNQWRSRVGQYRVLYEINDSESTVHVYRVAHRNEVYR